MKIALTSDTHYGHSHRTHKVHEKFLKKLADEDFDVLVHTGDWISCRQHELPRTFKMFREALGNKPILTVFGNHDLWDMDNWYHHNPKKVNRFSSHYNRKKSYRSMIVDHHNWMEEYNIHHLAWNPYQFEEDVMFYGFDGWYYDLPLKSNDPNFMPRLVDGNAPIDMFLSNEAHKALDGILEKQAKHKANNPHFTHIMCTHHPSYTFNPMYEFMCANPRFMEPICGQFDVLLVGHSHQQEDWKKDKCRIVNCGADYDLPKYAIIEIL